MGTAVAIASSPVAPVPPVGELDDLKSPEDYRAAGRSHLFPSTVSLRWFMRQHRARLVEGGALLMVAGRLVIDPRRFDAVVMAVGRERVGQAA